MPIRGKDIIVVGLQPWDNEIGSNCKDIALRFARHNRVLYVNNPVQRVSLKREKDNPLFQKRFDIVRNGSENLFEVEKNLWNLYPETVLESANFIPWTPAFRVVNRINNRRFARDIKRAADRLGFRDPILFNDSDMFRSYHLKELLQPALTVYYTRDHLLGFPYWHKHGQHLEPELMRDSDLVVANSTYLAELAGKHNPRSFYVGQGCDVTDFHPDRITTVPGDIRSIPGPVIGYIGALISLRLNLPLLEALAVRRPDWQIVLVGPEDDAFKASSLHRQANVHFLGLKDMSELPSYLARFDVAINPQVVNEVTIGNYPRKIDEYLAMGKPVVATPTKAMSIFAEQVFFAETADEYERAITKALQTDSPERAAARMELAQGHTWEASVEEIYRAMLAVRPELAASAPEGAVAAGR